MMDIKYTKLSALVDDSFTIEKVGDYVFKRWDPAKSKMLTSSSYQEEYRKLYPVTTDKGLLDVGSGQLGSLLETAQTDGSSNLLGKTFEVKSNGKTGLDIRYYFKLVRKQEPLPELEE